MPTLADKHWVVATQPVISAEYQEKQIDEFYRNRLRSLRSVDDIMAALYGEVHRAGLMNNTYFIFTSDHVSVCVGVSVWVSG